MKRLVRLLSPDPAEGGKAPDPQAPPIITPSNPTGSPSVAPPAPPAVSPPGAPPPAAKVVKEGTKTEREFALESDLRKVQERAAVLEDENRTLKTPPSPPNPAKKKKSWLDNGTFFHTEDAATD